MLPQSLLPWKQEKHKTPCCKDGSNSRIISDLDFAFNKCTNATHLELKINAFIVRHSGSRRGVTAENFGTTLDLLKLSESSVETSCAWPEIIDCFGEGGCRAIFAVSQIWTLSL